MVVVLADTGVILGQKLWENCSVAGPSPPPLAVITFQARLQARLSMRKLEEVPVCTLRRYMDLICGNQPWLISTKNLNDEYLLNIRIKLLKFLYFHRKLLSGSSQCVAPETKKISYTTSTWDGDHLPGVTHWTARINYKSSLNH